MAISKTAEFFQDEEGHWVARLECGHTQHVRHKPPLVSRPWVLSEEGRTAHLGMPLDCNFCDLPRLPDDLVLAHRTATFDQDSIPASLLGHHDTKADVWGRLVVEEGKLLYSLEGGDEPSTPSGSKRHTSWVLTPGLPGIIEPERRHRIQPVGPVRFFLEFWARP
ncbi:MAG TPA: DUF3565 domain-containing protein [Polyangiaceae bacterium]|nr:DUF3565 domain-containing protein [Polyangiaceae bacterium]